MSSYVDAFEEFILALDAMIKDGMRAEQALRAYVLDQAERIRERQGELEVK
jgi:hypothetical protein